MQAKKIKFWAITTGNEPNNGDILGDYVPFMTLGWTPATQVRYQSTNYQVPNVGKDILILVIVFAGKICSREPGSRIA